MPDKADGVPPRGRATRAAPPFTVDDPYRFWPTLGDVDLHLLGEGRHAALWCSMGARMRTASGGRGGTSFAVWAPNARGGAGGRRLQRWDGRLHPMRRLGPSGVWELFVPGVGAGARYKFEIVDADGQLRLKADPFAFATEVPPGHRQRGLRVASTSGATTPGWTAASGRTTLASADVDLRGATSARGARCPRKAAGR